MADKDLASSIAAALGIYEGKSKRESTRSPIVSTRVKGDLLVVHEAGTPSQHKLSPDERRVRRGKNKARRQKRSQALSARQAGHSAWLSRAKAARRADG